MQRVRKLVAADLQNGIDGQGVTVAVLDTGLGKHPDLAGRAVCFRDFVDNKERMYDNNGHGTHVDEPKHKGSGIRAPPDAGCGKGISLGGVQIVDGKSIGSNV